MIYKLLIGGANLKFSKGYILPKVLNGWLIKSSQAG
jgi:hypothetical protein